MTTKSTNDRTLSPSGPLVDHTYVQRMGCPALVFLVSTHNSTEHPCLPLPFSLFESVLTIGRAPRSSSWLYIYMPNITPKQRKGSFDHPYYPINIVNKSSTTTSVNNNNNDTTTTTNNTNNNITMSSPNQVPKSGATTFGDRKGSGTLFSGIEHYKRQDGPAAKQRRDSLKDMQPKPGFIANLWNK